MYIAVIPFHSNTQKCSFQSSLFGLQRNLVNL